MNQPPLYQQTVQAVLVFVLDLLAEQGNYFEYDLSTDNLYKYYNRVNKVYRPSNGVRAIQLVQTGSVFFLIQLYVVDYAGVRELFFQSLQFDVTDDQKDQELGV